MTQLTLAMNVSVNGCLSHMSALLAGQLFMVYSASQMKVVGTVEHGKCPVLSKQGFAVHDKSHVQKEKFVRRMNGATDLFHIDKQCRF